MVFSGWSPAPPRGARARGPDQSRKRLRMPAGPYQPVQETPPAAGCREDLARCASVDSDVPRGVDPEAVAAVLAPAVGGLAGPLRAELVEGGRSNLTYVIGDGEREWVLRRPPLAHVLPTAHDMAREYRVISALAPTDAP